MSSSHNYNIIVDKAQYDCEIDEEHYRIKLTGYKKIQLNQLNAIINELHLKSEIPKEEFCKYAIDFRVSKT